MFEFPVLIGDIGGTNARFAIVRDAHAQIERFDPAPINRYDTIENAIETIVLSQTSVLPATMMLAIATPLFGEVFRLTNGKWAISPSALMEAFRLSQLVLMNDFAAQGLAALALPESDLAPIGSGETRDDWPKAVIGPGTGLGIANLINFEGKWAIIPGEGGHVDLGPRTSREFELWPYLKTENGRVSAELAISGRGLENLYQAICTSAGEKPRHGTAAAISRAVIEASDKEAEEAVSLFLTLLARKAGDTALTTLARGGVYVSGGIAAKLLPVLDPVEFRVSFEDKAPHDEILRDIAIRVVTHPTAALEGLAACVQQPFRFSLQHCARIFMPVQ